MAQPTYRVSLVAEVGNYDNLPSDLRDALLSKPDMTFAESVKIINDWGKKDAARINRQSREAMSKHRIRYNS